MRKKIALLLSIVMIIASMPINAFAAPNKVYGCYKGEKCVATDESFNIKSPEQVIDLSTVTDLKVNYFYNQITCKDKTKLENINLDNINTVRDGMFRDFINVKTVYLNGVDNIGGYAFENTSIENIVIPNGIQNIDTTAFEGMPKLKTIDNQSGRTLNLQIGGATITITPFGSTVIGPRLEDADIIIDNTNPTFTYNLKPINFNDEEVTFTMVENLSGNLQVSANGVLSGATQTPDGRHYDECIVNAKSTSYDVNFEVVLAYIDTDQKFNLKLDVPDEYTCIVTNNALGDNVVSRDKIYEVKIEDKYGPVSNLDVVCPSNHGYHFVPFYFYDNTIYIDPTYISPEFKDIAIEMDRGYDIYDCIDEGMFADWATPIDSLPYSSTACLEPSERKIEFGSLYESNFSNVYSYKLPKGEALKISVSDIKDITPLIVNVAVAEYNSEFNEYTHHNDETYDFNKINVTGEEILFYNKYDFDAVIFISVARSENQNLEKSYKIDVEKYDYFKDLPATKTVETDLFFDNTTPSVDSVEGKYSWDLTTKTLTLKDGFYYYNIASGIDLPADATVVVEGDAAVVSQCTGFTFNEEVETSNTAKIIMNKGSHLSVLSGDEGVRYYSKDFQILGTPDAEGNLPKMTFYTHDNSLYNRIEDPNRDPDGNTTIQTSLYIKNIDLYSLSDDENIEIRDGQIKIEGCKLVLDAYDEENIYCNRMNNPTVDDAGCGLEIIDSELVCKSVTDENIESETGGINIKNSNLDFYAPYDDSIFCDNSGDINVENSTLNIVCDDEGIECDNGSATLADTKLSYKNVGEQRPDDYVIVADNEIVAPNPVKLYDKDGKLVFEGRLDELVADNGYDNAIILKDSEGNPIAITDTLPATTKTATVDNITIEELNTSYENGEDIVVVGEIPMSHYEVGDERMVAASWEILGTDKKGTYDEDITSVKIPTKGLPDGEYTAIVIFEKEVLAANGLWQKVTDDNGNVVTATKEIKFVVGQIPVPSEPNVKSPETGAELNIVFGSVLMLGLSLSVLTIVSRKKRTNK